MKWLFMFFIVTGVIFCEQSKNETESSSTGESNTKLVEAVLKVDGMTCGSCEYHVDRAAKKIDGVAYCKADSEKGQALIKYDPEKAELNEIITSITKSGYTAHAPESVTTK